MIYPKKSSVKGFLKILLYNLLAFICLIIVVEFLFDIRFHFNQPAESHSIQYNRRMQPPLIDGAVRPTKGYLKNTSGLPDDSYRMVTNQHGMILGPGQYDQRRSIDRCDILFMGGSTTECNFVRDSLRFAYRSAQLLSDRLNRQIVSLNGARSGNHTFHTVTNLIHTGLPYRPKVLVFMENINDLALLSKTGSYFHAPASRAMNTVTHQPKPGYVRHWIHTYLPNIYRHSMVLISRIEKRRGVTNEPADEFKGFRTTDNREEVILMEFEKALKTLHGICEANGIKLVLMTQFNRLDSLNRPFLDDINDHSGLSELLKWIPTYIRMNQLIRDYSRKHDILCIDLDREVPHTSEYIYDQVHLNNVGSVLVSEIIAREILNDPSLSARLSQ